VKAKFNRIRRFSQFKQRQSWMKEPLNKSSFEKE
jgi:hypothetical protein